jgi:hypothetical protein
MVLSTDSQDSLLGSAQEFLSEALRDFAGGRLNFAIVHAVTALELVLKERLRLVNPALVFRNIDSQALGNENTVSLGRIPQRLENLGLPLGREQARLIRRIAGWRHEIVHHMPTFDSSHARRQLPLLLDFIAGYLRRELATPLEDFLPRELFPTASQLLDDWRTAVDAAREKAAAAGDVLPLSRCPRCGGIEVVCQATDCSAHCHLCDADMAVADRCVQCGSETLLAFDSGPEGNICDSCLDAAGDAYASWLTDVAIEQERMDRFSG